MLRAIIKRTLVDHAGGCPMTHWYTVPFKSPELEQALTQGGHGEIHGMYMRDSHELVAVELLPDNEPKKATP
jgi:hypothetical protein